MLSKELEQLVSLSGGKLVISQGQLKSSYVLMTLENYLQEKKRVGEEPGDNPSLTERDLLARISSEIESFRKKNIENELEGVIEEQRKKEEEINYERLF